MLAVLDDVTVATIHALRASAEASARTAAAASPRPLSGDLYLELVRRTVPRPTTEQCRAYAQRVSGHHSWCKHLPLVEPGEPFLLYLHPHAHEVHIDRQDSAGAWRPFVRGGVNRRGWPVLVLDLQPGDLADEMLISLAPRYAEGLTTEEFRSRYGYWSYWNHGQPGQPVEQVLDAAAAQLRVLDDNGQDLPVAPSVLAASLVYLRGTVSPGLGPAEEEYETLRAERGLPSHQEDREDQLHALATAMERLIELVYGD